MEISQEKVVDIGEGKFVTLRKSGSNTFIVEYMKPDPDNGCVLKSSVVPLSENALRATAILAIDALGLNRGSK